MTTNVLHCVSGPVFPLNMPQQGLKICIECTAPPAHIRSLCILYKFLLLFYLPLKQTIEDEQCDSSSNGPSRKGSTMRINSMTPSSSSHHIGLMNGCNGDNHSEHNHTLERNDGRNSSFSSSHSPHRPHTTNVSYNNTSTTTICENQNANSHHHSLDRESNNRCYREIGQRQFYNTNPKPQAHSKQQKQPQKFQHSNNLASRQSMPMKTVAKSQSNLSNTIISKSDANMAMNSSDECLNFDRMSIHSQCNSDIYKNQHMILASSNSNKSSKQYCKYHNFN